MRLRWRKGSNSDGNRARHTTCTEDEASREGGRDCGCVVSVVIVGLAVIVVVEVDEHVVTL